MRHRCGIYRMAVAAFTICFFAFLPLSCQADFLDFLGITSGLEEEELQKICDARAGFESPGPISADGYYQPGASGLYGIDEIIYELGKGRFQYVEMDSKWVDNVHTWWPFTILSAKGNGRYTRFYLSKRGDPNCEAYESYVTRESWRSKAKAQLRVHGIYPDNCIAVVKTDTLKSKYKRAARTEDDTEIENLIWRRHEVTEQATGKVYASYKSFRYCFRGKDEDGSCRGGPGKTFRCRPKVEGYQNPTEAIYYGTIRNTPNPILKKRLEHINVREPFTLKPQLVTPELVEVLEGKENIEPLTEDEAGDFFKPIDFEGYAWFGRRDYRHRYSHSDPYPRNGYKEGQMISHQVDQINIINDKKRILYKTDIPFATTILGGYYHFCCIRAIEGDGIYFIAYPKNIHKKKLPYSHFSIAKFSWEGKLERLIEGDLPFEYILRGEPHHRYGKMRIDKDYFYFSVLVYNSEPNDDFYLTKEYVFRVPFQ